MILNTEQIILNAFIIDLPASSSTPSSSNRVDSPTACKMCSISTDVGERIADNPGRDGDGLDEDEDEDPVDDEDGVEGDERLALLVPFRYTCTNDERCDFVEITKILTCR
jgi:hypothetical protein